jgi:hypothetical protein
MSSIVLATMTFQARRQSIDLSHRSIITYGTINPEIQVVEVRMSKDDFEEGIRMSYGLTTIVPWRQPLNRVNILDIDEIPTSKDAHEMTKNHRILSFQKLRSLPEAVRAIVLHE